MTLEEKWKCLKEKAVSSSSADNVPGLEEGEQ